MTQPIVLYAGFDKGTDPVTGLTVTVNVYRITRSSGASSQIVTAGSATALGDGVYLYAIGSADLQTYDYLAAFKTTGDVDKKTVWAVYPALANAYATELARLDATVSSRNAVAPLDSTATQAAAAAALAAYDAATGADVAGISIPTAATIADAVWDETNADHTTIGSTGAALTAAGGAGDPWSVSTGTAYASDTFGGHVKSITPGAVTIVSPVATDGTSITLIRGDDYLNADNRALTFSGDSWPTLTGGSVALIADINGTPTSYAGTITGAGECYVELTDTQTAAMTPGTYSYDLQATLDNVTSSVVTLVQGLLLVQADVR